MDLIFHGPIYSRKSSNLLPCKYVLPAQGSHPGHVDHMCHAIHEGLQEDRGLEYGLGLHGLHDGLLEDGLDAGLY